MLDFNVGERRNKNKKEQTVDCEADSEASVSRNVLEVGVVYERRVFFSFFFLVCGNGGRGE